MSFKIINKLCVCLGICLVVGIINIAAQKSYTIVPGVKFGEITSRTSEADLKKIYGSKNVKRDEIGLGEGETMPGTVVFPNDEKKRFSIVWKNEKTRNSPDFIQFFGEKSPWKINNGVGIGTTLKELEKLNGKPFELAGFQWDYSGTVYSWKSGKLAKLFGNDGNKVSLMLNPDYEKAPAKDLDAMVGDGGFSSSHKSMQRLNPRVSYIIIKFP
ncbi:MAG: hypothetical protein K1X72_24505 [Pyrinomonadaceae bacterium]|nr:hypothetical protein [Pyrinomonadaceae bacterium]